MLSSKPTKKNIQKILEMWEEGYSHKAICILLQIDYLVVARIIVRYWKDNHTKNKPWTW